MIEQQEKKRISLKRKRILIFVAVAAVLIAVFTMGVMLGRGKENKPVITNDLISQQLLAVSDLATVEYRYTNMGKFENQIDFYGWKVPLTEKSFIVSYDGAIRAGIEVKGIEIEVEGDAVTVIVPRAKILTHEIFDDSLQIFDETQFIFNPLQISDYTGFTADQRGKIEQRALENGLLDEAQTKAEEVVRSLLSLMPGAENYKLTVRSVEES